MNLIRTNLSVGRIVATGFLALVGYAFGWVVGAVRFVQPRSERVAFLAESVPMPHHVPEHRGGASFRFAMVQDVIHERFAKHGPEYYTARNQLTAARLAALPAADPARFALTDDLGVGLERLGRSDEAITLLRAKLGDQRRSGLTGRDLYTTHANLGTFLIHGNFAPALRGEPAAREQFRAGVDLIRESVQLNPEAHFGRERWQAAIAEFLLAAMADPTLLKTFDCLGNHLDLDFESILDRDNHWFERGGYGRPNSVKFSRWQVSEVPNFFRPGVKVEDPALWATLSPIRVHVTKIGAEVGWDKVAVPSHRNPVPFDEPTLGIIGMWRQGGGANPHFALALGETMLRVGQRPLAWAAFERAGRLADRFWPDPALVDFLRTHCQTRQAQIEKSFRQDPAPRIRSTISRRQPGVPRDSDTADKMRTRFDAELRFGLDYQRRFQDYERARIEAGASVDDPHFDDDFPAGPTPIASPVGPEEWFVGVPPAKLDAYAIQHRRACGLFGAGLAALAAATLFRFQREPAELFASWLTEQDASEQRGRSD